MVRVLFEQKAFRDEIPNGEDLYVAVNLSVRQLRDPQLVPCVRKALKSEKLSDGSLTLELTESLLMDNPAAAAELLEQLRSAGVGLAIDDFGTGYSSLSSLRRLPVDRVKIDQSFIDGLDRDTSDESLVAAIVAMASALRSGSARISLPRMVKRAMPDRSSARCPAPYWWSRSCRGRP